MCYHDLLYKFILTISVKSHRSILYLKNSKIDIQTLYEFTLIRIKYLNLFFMKN